MNPWEEIDLSTYEKHMALSGVMQLQALHDIMRGQLADYPLPTVMILGVAGGNGLDLVDPRQVQRVYGVDLNPEYLAACQKRYGGLDGCFVPLRVDLTDSSAALPHADLVIANLLVEYVGCEVFAGRIGEIAPDVVCAVLQVSGREAFVSDSPYREAFDGLSDICREVDAPALTEALAGIGYRLLREAETSLPNGKLLLRLDYRREAPGNIEG